MQRDLIKRDLVRIDYEAKSRQEFIDRFVVELENAGYVKPSFKGALQAREDEYPTALSTEPEAIAIPHSDVEHILTPFIAPVRLRVPVEWPDMGDREIVRMVRIVFLLGFVENDGHVEILQTLLLNAQDPRFMAGLMKASTEEEYYEAVMSMNGLN